MRQVSRYSCMVIHLSFLPLVQVISSCCVEVRLKVYLPPSCHTFFSKKGKIPISFFSTQPTSMFGPRASSPSRTSGNARGTGRWVYIAFLASPSLLYCTTSDEAETMTVEKSSYRHF